MKSFYLTDAGKIREHNEDSVIIVKNHGDAYLLAVADGMGGHSCGEIASSIVISYLGHHFQESFYKMTKEQDSDNVNLKDRLEIILKTLKGEEKGNNATI